MITSNIDTSSKDILSDFLLHFSEIEYLAYVNTFMIPKFLHIYSMFPIQNLIVFLKWQSTV